MPDRARQHRPRGARQSPDLADQRPLGHDRRIDQGNGATLFVTNVLNGTVASGETPIDGGTVVRIGLFTPPPATAGASSPMEVIADGFPERTDPAALVIGPTGVALGDEGTLYVADTLGNRIAAVPSALFRQTPLGSGGITVAEGGYLNNPLGMTHRPERRHPDGQRRRWQHRRDDAVRRRVPTARHRRRRRRPVRAHRRAEPARMSSS